MGKISIVILAQTESLPAMRALESIEGLRERARLEVIVVNCRGASGQRRITERFPELWLVNVLDGATLAQARFAGVERATGDIIAMLHERYAVDDEWLAALEDAHREDVEVVGGPVAPRRSLTNEEWAMYLVEYSHIAPPVADGLLDLPEAAMLPGGNVSYKRRAFAMASMQECLWEIDFHTALHRAGARFLRRGKMCATFASPYTLEEYLVERRRVSQELAGLRARGMRGPARMLLAAAWLPLPMVLTLRTVRRVWAKPGLRRALGAAWPWIVRFSFVQTVAEMRGILSPDAGPRS